MNHFQRLEIYLTGKAYLEHRKLPGWKGSLSFYIFRCPKHGIVEDYPHGYRERLECPECVKERAKK